MGSTHLARTIMLEDLETLLAYINAPEAEKATYIRAIEKDVALAPWYHLFKGDRINDHHLTLQEKGQARKAMERAENGDPS